MPPLSDAVPAADSYGASAARVGVDELGQHGIDGAAVLEPRTVTDPWQYPDILYRARTQHQAVTCMFVVHRDGE